MNSVKFAQRISGRKGLGFLAPLLILLAGCTGVNSVTNPPPVVVSVTPNGVSVQTGQTQQFTATVTGATNTAVTWSLSSTSATAASLGTISATGMYTAPATVPTGGTVTVSATSQADTSKVASVTVTITAPAITVTLSPKTPSVQVGLTQQFTATVANTANTAVTWQVNGVTGGAAATGTISASGLFTAPASVPTGGTVTVKAISQADNTKSDTATVTVTAAPAISVALSPTAANVQAGIGTQNFTATLTNDTGSKGVTWSLSGTGCSGTTCGTLTNVTATSVTYNSPASAPSPAAVTLKATSVADTTKNATAAITVTTGVAVSIASASATVNVTKTKSFTATVSNDSQNKGVNWTLSGAGCSGATCGSLSATSSPSGTAIIYTAPAAVPSPALVTIKATSVADPNASFSSTITIVPAVSVSVGPSVATVTVGLTQTFTATVANDLLGQGVNWSLSGTGCSGATCGGLSTSSSASGVAITYTAPATVPSPATVTLTATSVTDNTKTGSATITVAPPPISVTLSPKTPSVQVGLTQQFTATVTNTSNTAVTWQVNGVTGGAAATGTINTTGLYTAPASVPTGTITVAAISQADSTKSDSTTVTITTAPPIVVTLAPTSASVQAGIGTQNFTATLTNDTGNKGVTWTISGTGCSGATCGTLTNTTTTTVTYNAPASVPSPATVTLLATSIADSTKSTSVAITVTAPIGVSVSPASASVNVGKTQSFTATVTNDSQNKGVNWTLSGAGCSGATCGTLSATTSASGAPITYTAPAAVPSPATVTIKATSVADGTRSFSSTITVVPAISVAVAPLTATVNVGLTQSFTATVSNDLLNQGVTWALTGAGCSGATCGTLSSASSASGVAITYTPPAAVPSPATVTLTATSVTDATHSGTATITVAPAISVAIAPATATVNVGLTQSFTATVSNDGQNKGVTWTLSGAGCSGATCGTLSATTSASGAPITYTAPAAVPSPATVTIKATSVTDGTRRFSSTITVAPAISVAVSPLTATVNVGLTQSFTATVSNDSLNQGVTWTLSGTGCSGATCGSLSTTSSASGVAITYTAPASVPSPATVTLTAKSVSDTSRTGTATITVAPAISVAIAPTSASVNVTKTQSFTATVTNDSQNKGVNWTLSGAGCSGSTCGALSATTSASGVAITYTAPASVPSPATVSITATSVTDGTKSCSATITVLPAISVAIAPTSASVNVTKTQSFTATVTNDLQNKGVNWTLSGAGCSGSTCGTLSASSSASGAAITYTAPAAVPSPATVSITATSVADATKNFSATITVLPAISVAVAPTTATVTVSLTQNFTATVSNDAQNKGVNWTLSGAGCSGATCGTLSATTSASGVAITYTAPAAVPSPATVTLTATSVADGTKTGTATITVQTAVVSGLSVAITPVRGGLTIGQSMNFTATVTNDVGAAGVSWSVTGGGSFPASTITSATYTAPATAGSVTVTATSIADITKSASATIGVTDLAGVATYHNNISRDGSNTREFTLTTTNVAKATFGKLFACTVDAAVYAQPLWVPNLTIGGTQHNVIIAVTQHDSIYVFDADASPCVTLWSKVGTNAGSLIPSGETWVTSGSSGTVDVPCGDLAPAIGIVGTPVVDLSTNTIYLVTKTKTITPVAFHQRLHALDITTGAEKFSGPVEISGSLASATFTPLKNNQRAGLALVNGNVYISWASHCDQGAYQGWVMAYSASTLSQTALFTPAPSAATSIESGIWMAGGAPAADSSNNLYLITGNGTFNPPTDFGDSLLKLATTSGISLSDYFTPSTQASDQTSDADLGSGGAAILVDQPSGPIQHLVIGGGKDGILFLLNRDNLGHNTGTDSGAIQLLSVGASIYATPAFWNNRLYIGGAFGNNHVQAFTFNTTTGKFASPNSSQSPTSFGNFPGTTPSVSANGTSQGIVWAIDASNNGTDGSTFGAAVLHAYDATNLATELWNSTQVAGDAAGTAVKFTVPTVANGKVYVGTQGEISVYGLKPN